MSVSWSRAYASATTVWCVWALLLATVASASEPSEDREKGWEWRSPLQRTILVNQVGFLPKWPKRALLQSAERIRGSFEVREHNTGDIVFSGRIGAPRPDPWTGGWLADLDFSQLRTLGSFRVRVEGAISEEFEIGSGELHATLRLLLRSYYLQRCGVAVDDPETGMRRPACHVRDGVRARGDTDGAQGEPIPGMGGWHDAGDYGKYVAPGSVAVAQLLSLVEQFPERFPDGQLGIPESGNGVSDVVDEIRFEMEWLLRMQRSDGAVYRKLSGDRWPHDQTPWEDVQVRYVYGISTPETGKFAATTALAARVFQAIDPKFSDQLLSASLRSWSFLESQPKMEVDWQKSDDSGSGKYLRSDVDQDAALARDRDDRAWAAAELFITTGEERFEAIFEELVSKEPFKLFEWKNALLLGVEHYVISGEGDRRFTKQLERRLRSRARRVSGLANASAYQIANRRFIWGSNKMTAQEGWHLLTVHSLSPSRSLLVGAVSQLDFLLGRNPHRKSFVTGVGERSVDHVCHLYGTKAGLAIPGLLVGGPNSGAQAGIAPKGLGLLSYADHHKSYATNEYAIDYNAALIALLVSLLEAEPR